jgi:HK97 family phage major capsid protein
MDYSQLLKKAQTFVDTAERIIETAGSEERSLTAAEQRDVDGLERKAEEILETVKRAKRLADLESRNISVLDPRNAIDVSPGFSAGGGTKGLEAARIIRAIAAGRGDHTRTLDYASRFFNSGVVRGLSANDGPSGGYLLADSVSREVIEALQARTVLRRMGSLVLPQTEEIPLVVPLISASSTGTYIGEGSNISATSPTLGSLRLTARKLAAIVAISNDLLRGTSGAADQIVSNDLLTSLTVTEDVNFIRGDGAGAGPRGLRYWAPAANLLNMTSPVTVASVEADISALMLRLLNANCRMITPGWIMAPRTRVYLENLRDSVGAKVFPELQQGRLRGYPVAETTSIPITLGTGGNESEIYFVDFADCAILQISGLLVEASTQAAYVDENSNVVSAFSTDRTLVRVISLHDFGMRHAASVAVQTDCTWGA